MPWDRSPVPAEHQIRGLGPIVMSVPASARPMRCSPRSMGLRPVRGVPASPTTPRTRCTSTRWARGARTPSCTSPCSPTLAPARLGAGGVHHVAFRTPNEAEYHAWRERLDALGMPNSGEVDRYYFRSLYFREPNGILFEIATDGPGFAVDEDPATLGEHVALPPFLEPRREAILAGSSRSCRRRRPIEWIGVSRGPRGSPHPTGGSLKRLQRLAVSPTVAAEHDHDQQLALGLSSCRARVILCRMPLNHRKLLLIDLDAADASLVERWIAMAPCPRCVPFGMPGPGAAFSTSARYLTGSPWPTFYTGRPPSDHGIYHDFQWRQEDMGFAAPATDWLPVRPFWREIRGTSPRSCTTCR